MKMKKKTKIYNKLEWLILYYPQILTSLKKEGENNNLGKNFIEDELEYHALLKNQENEPIRYLYVNIFSFQVKK